MGGRTQKTRTRRGTRGGGRSGGGTLGGGITRVAFHRISATTMSGATGTSTVVVNPQSTSLGDLDDVGNQFDLFRVSKLKYRLHPMDPSNLIGSLAYIPDIDVQTATATQLSGSPIAVVQTPFSGVPSPWMTVPKSQLKGMLDWYKCVADAGAAEFESQGVLYLACGLSDVLYWEVRGIMEFKNPVSNVIMMERFISSAERAGKVVRIPTPKTPGLQTAGVP